MSSPIVKATLQAAFLSAVSNVMAQSIQAYQTATPLSLNVQPIIQFVVFTFINCPPNFLWQEYLESTFPGYTVAPRTMPEKSSEKTGAQKQELVPQKTLNVRNTAIKFTLDQTIGALINTIFFVATMTAFKGGSYDQVVRAVRNDVWPLMLAGYKLWPIVSLLAFTVIPVEQRIVFGSLVGVGWGVYLSLLA